MEDDQKLLKELAIQHQRWGDHMRWEITQNNALHSKEYCEKLASLHYAQARNYMGIKDEDQYYA